MTGMSYLLPVAKALVEVLERRRRWAAYTKAKRRRQALKNGGWNAPSRRARRGRKA